MSPTPHRTRIGLLGFTGVGRDLAVLLEGRPQSIHRIGLDDARHVEVPSEVVVQTIDATLEDEEIDVFVDLLDDTERAYAAVRAALERRRPVVTANAPLVAKHGAELSALARRSEVAFRFEASLAGALPIVPILQTGLVYDEVQRLFAILDGATNDILTSGQRDGIGFREALARAHERGLVAAPKAEVRGVDTAQKLAVLASLLTNRSATVDELAVQGIERVGVEDHRAAEELGFRIKHLGLYRAGPPAALRVAPTLVGANSAVGLTTDEYNVVEVECRRIGWQLHLGKGAGSMPTAAALLHDLEHLSDPSALVPTEGPLELERPRAWRSRWLVRLPPSPTPRSTAEIGGVLERFDVPIDELRRSRRTGVGTLVVTQHARAGDVETAARQLDPGANVLGIEAEA